MPATISASRASCWAGSTPRSATRSRWKNGRGRSRGDDGNAVERRRRSTDLLCAQLLLSFLNAAAELLQLAAAHQLTRLGEHLLLFLVGVVFDQVLENFRLRGEVFVPTLGVMHFAHDHVD